MIKGNKFIVMPSLSLGDFDALRILDNEFIVAKKEDAYKFETPKDELGRIISVNCDERIRPITYDEIEDTKNIDVQILENKIMVKTSLVDHMFEMKKDKFGRIASVSCDHKNRKIYYESRSFAGVEYEQIHSGYPNLTSPKINNVGVFLVDTFP